MKYLPTKNTAMCAQNRRQTVRPRNFFHEIAKITTFTKILPLEKYPLYSRMAIKNVALYDITVTICKFVKWKNNKT